MMRDFIAMALLILLPLALSSLGYGIGWVRRGRHDAAETQRLQNLKRDLDSRGVGATRRTT